MIPEQQQQLLLQKIGVRQYLKTNGQVAVAEMGLGTVRSQPLRHPQRARGHSGGISSLTICPPG